MGYMRELIADYLITFKAHDMNEVDFRIVKNTGGLFERMTSMDMRLSVARGMVKLGELEPGSLFIFKGTIAVKSAYRNNGACECTIIGDGSAFWGGTKTAECLNNLLVQPAKLTPNRGDFLSKEGTVKKPSFTTRPPSKENEPPKKKN